MYTGYDARVTPGAMTAACDLNTKGLIDARLLRRGVRRTRPHTPPNSQRVAMECRAPEADTKAQTPRLDKASKQQTKATEGVGVP
mmetsp:Transcript_30752/g.75648  ORF Transcript_30752/g.75648 Transcript_30752/m.75648 type:complete len:85 (+) Transcript_30752:304-558(+)